MSSLLEAFGFISLLFAFSHLHSKYSWLRWASEFNNNDLLHSKFSIFSDNWTVYFLCLFKLLLSTGVWTNLVGFLFHRTDGIGLSAPQVGLNVQLMVFNSVGERGEGEEIVLVNPRVTRYSKKMVLFDEGCLSFPGIYAEVKVVDKILFIVKFIYLWF